jgi:predicted NBD/HSP70 family sugar kinase
VSSDRQATRRATGTKVAHGTMREVNRSIVLDILREGEPISRVELARRTRLSKPTVSSIVEHLVGAGLAREVGTDPSSHRSGRPPSLLVYNQRAVAFAGIQFGVNTTHVSVADGLGNLVASATVPAVHGDAGQSIRDAQKALRQAIARSGVKREQIGAVGVAVPGLVEPELGVCVIAPNLDWHDAPIQKRIETALGVPAVVVNSTHAAAIAEARLAGEEHRVLVWVYAGSGVGAGIVIDGVLYRGASGYAGELGHSPVLENGVRCSCGNRGCLETVAGSLAIVRRAGELIRGGAGGELRKRRRGLTADTVAALAAQGDRSALAAMREAGDFLGRGIASLVNVLGPSMVVLGGPLAMMSTAYVDAARESVVRHALPAQSVPVQVTSLGPDAPLLGVVQLAMGQATPSYRVVGQVLSN